VFPAGAALLSFGTNLISPADKDNIEKQLRVPKTEERQGHRLESSVLFKREDIGQCGEVEDETPSVSAVESIISGFD